MTSAAPLALFLAGSLTSLSAGAPGGETARRPVGGQDPAVTGRSSSVATAQTPGPVAEAGATTPDEDVQRLRADRDPAVRRAAAEALGASGDPEVAGPLLEATTRDPDPTVRAAAAAAAQRLWRLRRSPALAAGLSLLCPGCGHFYLRRYGEGTAFLGSTVALFAGGLALVADSAEIEDGILRFANNRGPLGLQLLGAGQNLWFYSLYAAYRDARIFREDRGFSHPGSRETLGELVTAPVRPRVLASPWFWAGLPAMVGAAGAFTAVFAPDYFTRERRTLPERDRVNVLGAEHGRALGFGLGETYLAGLFLPVGVGEEALFRGVLQPMFSEWLGPWGGWALSSSVFGVAHLGNFVGRENSLRRAAINLPFLTLIGGYLGLASMQTGNNLATSVALHFWYDFLIGTTAFLLDPDKQSFAVRIGLPF